MSSLRGAIEWRAAAIIACGAVVLCGVRASAAPHRGSEIIEGRAAAAGEILVRFRQDSPGIQLSRHVTGRDVDIEAPVGSTGWRVIHSTSRSVGELLAAMRARADVATAEPNYEVHVGGTPNDLTSALWGLQNTGQMLSNGDIATAGADIDAVHAWDLTTGTPSIVVATVDTGIMASHQDLAPNVWSAPSSFTVTIGATTVTCPAGTHGFNAVALTCDPADDNGHGTHVAGSIGAAGNNGTGVVGVNWTASIMALKFLDASGNGYVSDAIDAIEFAIQAKQAFAASGAANVRVLNNSWDGGGYSQAMADEIQKAADADMLFVAAAGNNASDNDSRSEYPASYTTSNVIAVGATDYHDRLSTFSNYGTNSVQIAAPGSLIYSTTILPSNPTASSYTTMSGTSMATAYVSGAAALVLSHCPYSTSSLRNALLSSATSLSWLAVQSGRRLNASAAVSSCDTNGSSSTSGGGTPFSGAPAAIPGAIEAENFDDGGEGIAYHDTTAGNSGGAYRQTDVDIEAASPSGYDVGWTTAGEWLRYSVDVQTAGSYTVTFRVASAGQGGTFHLEANGTDVTGPMTISDTGGWQSWQTIAKTVTLVAGPQVLRLVMDADGAAVVGNFDSMTFDLSTAGATTLPGTINAAEYDAGGEGVAYHDTTRGNSGGAHRQDDVDIEASSEGGYDVGWTAPGEWLNYTVDVPTAGAYTVQLRVASPSGGASMHVGFNDASHVWDAVAVPATGGWQNWTTVGVPVTLGAGIQQVTILFDTGDLNLRSITVTSP